MPDIFDPLRCYLNYAEARGLRSDRLAEARYVRFAASQQRVSVIYNSIKNSQNRFIVFETPISIGISSEDIDLQPPSELLRPKTEGDQTLKLLDRRVDKCLVGVTFGENMHTFGDPESLEYKRIQALGGVREPYIWEIIDIFVSGFSEEDRKKIFEAHANSKS
ncbi:MAG TPA: hypothetical protein VJA47_02145 [archaeon]|nr:hypothetical protein [archaeon]